MYRIFSINRPPPNKRRPPLFMRQCLSSKLLLIFTKILLAQLRTRMPDAEA